MAKIKLSPLIQSMSGTIIRRKLPNGVSVACVVTKKNYDSRNNDTDRSIARENGKECRILLPDIAWETNNTTMPEEKKNENSRGAAESGSIRRKSKHCRPTIAKGNKKG